MRRTGHILGLEHKFNVSIPLINHGSHNPDFRNQRKDAAEHVSFDCTRFRGYDALKRSLEAHPIIDPNRPPNLIRMDEDICQNEMVAKAFVTDYARKEEAYISIPKDGSTFDVYTVLPWDKTGTAALLGDFNAGSVMMPWLH